MTRELQGASEIEHRHEVAQTGNTAHEHTHTNVPNEAEYEPICQRRQPMKRTSIR